LLYSCRLTSLAALTTDACSQMNARLVGVFRDGRLQDTHWHDVQVGDFIRVGIACFLCVGLPVLLNRTGAV